MSIPSGSCILSSCVNNWPINDVIMKHLKGGHRTSLSLKFTLYQEIASMGVLFY